MNWEHIGQYNQLRTTFLLPYAVALSHQSPVALGQAGTQEGKGSMATTDIHQDNITKGASAYLVAARHNIGNVNIHSTES